MDDDQHPPPPGAEADNASHTQPPTDRASADTRFRSYVTFYSNLDTLIWKNVSTMLTVTAIGAGFMGALATRPDLRIEPLSHNNTLAVGFLLISLLYFVSVFTLRRMRYHHVLLENHLRQLEDSGYFHDRRDSVRKWWLAATTWNAIAFSILGVVAFASSIYHFEWEDEVMAKIWISTEEAASRFGIQTNHEQMENGELRFRLMGGDGNGYIRTVAGERGSWQKSHFHMKCKETYVVENGWMAVARPSASGDQAQITIYEPGEIYTTAALEIHNVYLPARALIHTVKHGSASGPTADWHASEKFDQVVARIDEEEILRFRKTGD